MRLGVVFPQTEIGSDPGAVREYVQAAEGMGYQHLIVYERTGSGPQPLPGLEAWPESGGGCASGYTWDQQV